MLCAGGCGEDGGEVIAAKADDIAGERGEIAKQGVEAVHQEWFAICRVGAFAGGLASGRAFHSATNRLALSGAARSSSFDATTISPSLTVAGAVRHSVIPSLPMI